MKQLGLGIIVAIGLTLPAAAFDGRYSPNSPPLTAAPLDLDLPADLLAQANPGGAARPHSLKQQIVGTWTLVSCTDPSLPWCAGTNGIQVFDASGHYVVMMAARGRPKVTGGGADRNAVTPEEYKAIAMGVFANFGTWSIGEAFHTLTYHADGALFPNGEGTDWATFTISISGDELRQMLQTGQPAVWRRVSK